MLIKALYSLYSNVTLINKNSTIILYKLTKRYIQKSHYLIKV